MNQVLVDFENVPNVDLALIRDLPAQVTLFIGEKQRRLDLGLVRAIHTHASQVALVEVGASGRNALDMVLAWHLGQAVERAGQDAFFVVSKDKDFDPLIKHLRARGLAVTRIDSFAALPFLRSAATAPRETTSRRRRGPQSDPVAAAPGRSEPRVAHRSEKSVAQTKSVPDPRLAKLIDRLQHRSKARPVRRKTLLTHINGFYANQLSPTELEGVVASLQELGVLALDASGRVKYESPGR